jgi:hypothetical protein
VRDQRRSRGSVVDLQVDHSVCTKDAGEELRGASHEFWVSISSERNREKRTRFRGPSTASRDRLRTPVREWTITVSVLDAENGEWRQEQKRLAPVSGYDLVFSCPKNVSLVHALTDDGRVRQEISDRASSTASVTSASNCDRGGACVQASTPRA